MPASDDKNEVKDGLAQFHLRRDAFSSLLSTIRASSTVIAIIALFPAAACTLISIALLLRLGWDSLTLSGIAYQESAKNFLFAFASVFGAPFLVWRTWVAHQQATAAAKQARVALENHVTGIFSKSIELLGAVRDVKTVTSDGTATARSAPNLESRLGALYSLERLLRESDKDQRAVLETLCAYIRENSPAELPQDETERQDLLLGKTTLKPSRRNDVQAAITIIGRRPPQVRLRAEREDWRLDLRNSNLVSYDFSALNFDGSDFTDSFLNNAKLADASFAYSVFRNTVLQKTKMDGATFRFSRFQHCNVKDAEIENTDFRDTVIAATDLREARVTNFHIGGANLDEAFSSYLQYAVDDVKENGAKHAFHITELAKVVELFGKANHDDKTSVSQAVQDAIRLLTVQTEEARGPE